LLQLKFQPAPSSSPSSSVAREESPGLRWLPVGAAPQPTSSPRPPSRQSREGGEPAGATEAGVHTQVFKQRFKKLKSSQLKVNKLKLNLAQKNNSLCC
jgi:hypothetical protein